MIPVSLCKEVSEMKSSPDMHIYTPIPRRNTRLREGKRLV